MEETTMQTAPESVIDPAMEEHRAALGKMRCDYALEQLYAASGAHDPAVLRRLIDIGDGDIVMDGDGIPDVTAVRDKIDVLRREQPYLFCDTSAPQTAEPVQTSAQTAVPRASTGMRLGVMTQADLSALDDAAYYRAVMARKNGRRR